MLARQTLAERGTFCDELKKFRLVGLSKVGVPFLVIDRLPDRLITSFADFLKAIAFIHHVFPRRGRRTKAVDTDTIIIEIIIVIQQ